MRRAATTLFVLLALARAAPARGDDAHQRASESFREAQAAYERRDFAAAAAAFEQAGRYEPHPAPFLNAADSWERVGDFARAAEDCDSVLAMGGLTETQRTDGERRLARLITKVGTLTIHGPRTALVRLDGGVGFHPPATRRLAPGRHLVATDDLVTQSNRSLEVDLAAGTEKMLDVASPPPSEVSPPAAPRPTASAETPTARAASHPVPVSAWIAGGAALASAGVATTFGFFTLASRDDYNRTPTLATRSAFYRNRLITDLAWGASAVSAIAAVVLWRVGASSGDVGIAPAQGGGVLLGRVSLP
jgi:hypothetical protein